MFKKCNIIMLPTNEASFIYLYENKLHSLANLPHDIYLYNGSNQHLYIISDEEIKEGDWFISIEHLIEDYKIDSEITQRLISKHNPELLLEEGWINGVNISSMDGKLVQGNFQKEFCKKIVVSTQLSLSQTSRSEILQIPQSFIEEYITEYNKGNIITDVMVEYEEYMTEGWVPTYNNPDNHNMDESAEIDIRLKINSNNTINIKGVKDSWNREEVI